MKPALDAMGPQAYIAQDRRLALATGGELPAWAWGSVLFADISGFTPLSEALARSHGLRRGAEMLTRLLNQLYAQIIADVENYGGSVVGFSGDAIACWFAGGAAYTAQGARAAALRAAAAAAAMHSTLRNFSADAPLAIKIAITSGRVRRFVVGNPAIQRIDVMAGEVVDRMGSGEELAARGETLADTATFAALGIYADAAAWRGPDHARFAPVPAAAAAHAPPAQPVDLPEVDTTGWIHPAVAPLLHADQARYLAELRPATALFVRFVGINFEQRSDAPARLDAYIAWAQAVIQRYAGLLIQLTTGDKGSYFYAAFGAPLAHGDDPARAAAAALDLLNPPPEFAGAGPLQIGISTGMMRVGAYGGPTRCTYGVLGDEVNLAARLMALAAPGQVLLTQAAADALRGIMALEELQARAVKGKAEPVALFALHGRLLQPAPQLKQAYAAALVGRTRELDMLTAELAPVVAGGDENPGRILIIEGGAGIGKSHLAAALVSHAEALGMRIIHAACQSTAQAIPNFAARQLVHALLDLPAAADADQVQAAVAALDAEAAPRVPLLAELLGIPMPDSPLTAGLDARVRQGARTAFVLALVAAAARRLPLLVTLEDAHWADEASRELFAHLADALAPLRAALLVVQRPAEADAASLLSAHAPAHTLRLQLGELSPAATADLVAQRLHGAVQPLAAALIHAQAHGNPFFVEELVEALREAGRLAPTVAGWQLSDATVTALRAAHCLAGDADAPHLRDDAPLDTVDLGVPTSVQGVVLARLDRLPETARLTLKVASVIGRTFALDLLQAVQPLQHRHEAVQRALADALARDFVRADAAADALQDAARGHAHITYIFKHNIIRDVAYNTLLEEQQRELHLAVAQALEPLRPGDFEELAHHYYHSDTAIAAVRSQAVRYLAMAAQRAQQDYANDTALLYYARAAALAPRADFLIGQAETLHILGRRDDEHALLLQLDVAPDATPAVCARLWGDYYESVADYAQAEAALSHGLAAATHNPLAQAQCLNRLGMVAWRQGDYLAAEAHFEAAHARCRRQQRTPEAADLAAEIANAHYGLGLVYRQLGRYDEAHAAFAADLAWQRSHGSRERAARAITALGHVESIRGRHAQALEAYNEALAMRKAIGDRAGIGASLLAVAQAYGSLGDHAQALPRLEEALRLQQAIRSRFDEWLIWNEIGILHWLVGHYAEAESALSQGLAVSRAINSDFGAAYLLCNLGQLQRDAGRLHEAALSLRAALALARAQGDSGLEATCLSDLALTLVALNDPDAALEAARAAASLFSDLGQEDSLTAALAAQAQAQLALGRSSEALATARRGISNLHAHPGDYFTHRDGYWCACVLQSCGVADEAAEAFQAAARALAARAERISNLEMRSSYLNQVAVNRAILAAAQQTAAGASLLHGAAHGG